MNRKTVYRLVVLIMMVLLPGVLVQSSFAASSNLPGGTAISVTIDNLNNGDTFYLSPGETSLDLTVQGTAAIGEGTPIANTSILYVLDGSGSTELLAGVDCGPDQNPGDPQSTEDEVIDCEIEAAIALNDLVGTLGTIDEAGAIIFAGDGVAADMVPAAGNTPFTAPAADLNSNSQTDLNEVLASILIAEFTTDDSGFTTFSNNPTPDIIATNYENALITLGNAAAVAGNPDVIAIFISDGINNAGSVLSQSLVNSILPASKDVTIHTFAIPDSAGIGGTCASNPNGLGSLQQIANFTGGTCATVGSLSDLADVLPQPIIPVLASIDFAVNGSSSTLPNSAISLPLPQDGPQSVTYETEVAGLGLGTHDLCATANGSDAGGSGDVTECVEINIVAPPVIDPVSCANPGGSWIDITGVGLRDGDPALNYQTSLPIADPASIDLIMAQVTAKEERDVPAPTQVQLTAGAESHTLTTPLLDEGAYLFDAAFGPQSSITVEVMGADAIPLSLVAYTYRQTSAAVSQSFQTVNRFMENGRYTTRFPIETSGFARDVVVRFVLSDMDPDLRTVRLFARAGRVRERVTVNYPNMGDGLLIYDLVLPNVPKNVSRVTARVISPHRSGDSIFWNSVSASMPCTDSMPGTPVRVTDDLLTLYNFEEGSGTLVTDDSGAASPIDLTIVDSSAVTWQANSLRIDDPTQLVSAAAAASQTAALQASNEITVEFWGIVANKSQDGPARIVSLSADPSNSNFTFGQEGNRYSGRLRTTETTANGRPALETNRGSVRTRLQHIVYTRDSAGVARFYIDGVEKEEGVLGGNFSNWDSSFSLIIGNEWGGDRPWLGELDLIAIYSRALTAAEVMQNFNAGS